MHEHYLKQALALADIRRGFCAPNPAVGAVLVKDNQVLATGHHWASGHPHAEAAALSAFNNNESLEGATIYITLEPCCHFGKTPPCTDLLIRTGIKRVIYGMRDPNPQVADKSLALLKEAGIETIYLPLPEIQDFYKSYAFWWRTNKPYITAKIALSLDGKIAGAQGRRINLTGETAGRFTHEQRKRSDAILTTARTIIYDNPLLNVRLTEQTVKKPVYVLDSHLTTPLNAKLFTTAEKVILFHKKITAEKVTAYLKKGAVCIEIGEHQTGLDLAAIVEHIGKEGVHDLWIEAGGRCFAAFAQRQLLQRAFIYVAPKWLGEDAQTAFNSADAIFNKARQLSWRALGNDAICDIIF